MPKKAGKSNSTVPTEDSKKTPLGTSPAVLAKRKLAKNVPWCPVSTKRMTLRPYKAF